MSARISTGAKLKLTLIGVILCLLSFYSFTHTSLYIRLEGFLSSLLHVGIPSSIILFVAAIGLVALGAIHTIRSYQISKTKLLYNLALVLFTPVALAFSELGWILPLRILRLTTDIQVGEAIGIGTVIGCGILLCGWYSEYIDLKNELIQRGGGESSSGITLGLMLGIALILSSGIMAFFLGISSVYVLGSTAMPTTFNEYQIIIIIIFAIALIYVSLWYLERSRVIHSNSPE